MYDQYTNMEIGRNKCIEYVSNLTSKYEGSNLEWITKQRQSVKLNGEIINTNYYDIIIGDMLSDDENMKGSVNVPILNN